MPDTTTLYYHYTKPIGTDIYPTAKVCMVVDDTSFICLIADVDCSTEYNWLKIVTSQDNIGVSGLLDFKVVAKYTKWEKFPNTSIYGKVCRELKNQ